MLPLAYFSHLLSLFTMFLLPQFQDIQIDSFVTVLGSFSRAINYNIYSFLDISIILLIIILVSFSFTSTFIL